MSECPRKYHYTMRSAETKGRAIDLACSLIIALGLGFILGRAIFNL